MFAEALPIIGVSIGTVFVVLGLFYGVVVLMMKIFPAKDEGEN